MAKKPDMGVRIDEALNGRSRTFFDLAMILYPDRKSWRYQSNGGPPGCFMTLSAALRRHGFQVRVNGPGPGERIVVPRESGEKRIERAQALIRKGLTDLEEVGVRIDAAKAKVKL